MKKHTIDQNTMIIFKSTLMLYALNKDYFSYGTKIEEKNSRYKVETMEGTWYYSRKDLAYEWDLQDNELKRIVLNDFIEHRLLIECADLPTFDLTKEQKEYYIGFIEDTETINEFKSLIDERWTITPDCYAEGDFTSALVICNEEYDLLTKEFAKQIYNIGDKNE